MVFENISAEQVAAEWVARMREKMGESGKVPEAEIDEMCGVAKAFTLTAAQLLKDDPSIQIPNTSNVIVFNDYRAHMVIELFLRGINQSVKRLKERGMDWEARKVFLEGLSWKMYNLAKLLVGMQLTKDQPLNHMMKTPRDLKLMMKHSAEELLNQELQGTGVT